MQGPELGFGMQGPAFRVWDAVSGIRAIFRCYGHTNVRKFGYAVSSKSGLGRATASELNVLRQWRNL